MSWAFSLLGAERAPIQLIQLRDKCECVCLGDGAKLNKWDGRWV